MEGKKDMAVGYFLEEGYNFMALFLSPPLVAYTPSDNTMKCYFFFVLFFFISIVINTN